MFIGLLIGILSVTNHTKFVSLSNQKGTKLPTIIILQPNEYTTGLHYYPSAVNLDRCVGSCNTFNDFSNKVYVLTKTEDLILSVFNMTTRINESYTLTKHISSECKCKLDDRKCNSNQQGNNDKC